VYQNSRRPPARPSKRRIPKRSLIAAILGCALVAGGAVFVLHHHRPQSITYTRKGATAPPTDSFDTHRYSVNDPTSIWVVVNKQRPLSPKDYAPADLRAPAVPLRRAATDPEMQLREEAALALEKLTAGAKADGLNLMLASGYRSYNVQVAVYGSEVKAYGQTKADTESARPGYSEHQTGLAMDLEPASRKCEIADCFGDTPEGKWVAANAYKYGFLLRYTPAKVAITGYRAEAWHIRYIGTDLSNEMHSKHITTLEEFFGLPAAPSY